MVTVYEFERFNMFTGEMHRSRCKMTAEKIMANTCAVLDGSGEEVPESALDADGRYYPDA
jgi:hypothetical protein